jgi:replicative DNA helicase
MLLSDALAAVRADADAANLARVQGTPRGPLSGLPALDLELGGAFGPGLHMMHGQPGAGKTAFALQVAASCQCPALFVTCEMAPAELLRRHTARVTKTFLGRLKSGEMPGQDVENLVLQAIEAAPRLAFVDATRDPAPPAFLTDAAQVVKGKAPHLLVVVDSLHSWAESCAPDAPEYEALNFGLAAMRRLAQSLQCPFLVVAERNRESMSGGGLSAGAGTRKIEYGAETVIDLERARDVRPDGAGEVDITLTLRKNRHGAAGAPLKLRFNGALQRFQEVQR